jgi:acyl carrier protein
VKREPRADAPADLRATLLQILADIAPEIDPSGIDPGALLREQVDLDSADWLDFLTAIEQRLGVSIADTEAARLRTLDQIAAHCASAPAAPAP